MKDDLLLEKVESRIFLIRGQKVMVDRDLAQLYGVKTKALNQAVQRNRGRFPADFMFLLTKSEKNELVTNCDRFTKLKHSSALPLAFTEQGVAMLSSVLNNEKAVLVNIFIIRAFVKLRQVLATHKELALKFKELENRVDRHDAQINSIFEAIRKMIALPGKPARKIGFAV